MATELTNKTTDELKDELKDEIYGTYSTGLKFNLTIGDFDESTILLKGMPDIVRLSDLPSITISDIELMEKYASEYQNAKLSELILIRENERLFYCWKYLGFKIGKFAGADLETMELLFKNELKQLLRDEVWIKMRFRAIFAKSPIYNVFCQAVQNNYTNCCLYIINYVREKNRCTIYRDTLVYLIKNKPQMLPAVYAAGIIEKGIIEKSIIYTAREARVEFDNIADKITDVVLLSWVVLEYVCYIPSSLQETMKIHTTNVISLCTESIFTELIKTYRDKFIKVYLHYGINSIENLIKNSNTSLRNEIYLQITNKKCLKDGLKMISTNDTKYIDNVYYYHKRLAEEHPEYKTHIIEETADCSLLNNTMLIVYHKIRPDLINIEYIFERFVQSKDLIILIYCVRNNLPIEKIDSIQTIPGVDLTYLQLASCLRENLTDNTH